MITHVNEKGYFNITSDNDLSLSQNVTKRKQVYIQTSLLLIKLTCQQKELHGVVDKKVAKQTKRKCCLLQLFFWYYHLQK